MQKVFDRDSELERIFKLNDKTWPMRTENKDDLNKTMRNKNKFESGERNQIYI